MSCWFALQTCSRVSNFSSYVWAVSAIFHVLVTLGMVWSSLEASMLCYGLFGTFGLLCQATILIPWQGTMPSEALKLLGSPMSSLGNVLFVYLPMAMTLVYIYRRAGAIRVYLTEIRHDMDAWTRRFNMLFLSTSSLPLFYLWSAVCRSANASIDLPDPPGIGTLMWTTIAGSLGIVAVVTLRTPQLTSGIVWIKYGQIGFSTARRKDAAIEAVLIL